jgi:hypothetical protein
MPLVWIFFMVRILFFTRDILANCSLIPSMFVMQIIDYQHYFLQAYVDKQQVTYYSNASKRPNYVVS